ncbi:MAG: DUF308 domain-containing protein [Bacteroidales bacterium]|nr:DUF308 domain-containing protein [Bacteroidales bacterium]
MKKSTKIFLALSGILLIILGVVCICNPAETLFTSAWLIGLLTLLSGIFTMIFTFRTQRFLPNSGSRMLSALLQIILGILFLSHKALLSASLPVIFAFWIIIEGITLAIESFDFKKVGFSAWWCILLLGICAAVLGYFGLRNPLASGSVLSTLIGLAVIAGGASYLVALGGVKRFEKFVKEIQA